MTITNSFFSLLRDTAFGKVVASLTIAAILLPLYPSVAGASGPPPGHGPGSGAPGLEKAPGQALSKSIREVNGVLENADRAMKHGQTIAAEMQALAKLRKEIEMLDAEVRAEFDEVSAWIHERQLPETIIERHDQAVALYQDEIGMLLDDLALLEAASAEEEIATTVERVHERLSRQQHETSPHPFDPAQLPHAAQRPRPDNVPRGGRDEFLGAGLVDNPLPQLAALPGYRFDALPGADDPAYLAETIEAQLSPKIRAKAESLGYDPVMIYHWVRNHVEWLPTWGAVQDADLTLSARRGNAMDISSLLISLLRASGIPSRYVHGTIEVPEAEFRNWIGGFKHIEEALNFASAGGIPITGIITGGQISHVRMEHIWVEAAIDFLPSRGAVMRSADTWLALDTSYKQYEFFPGVDVKGVSGVDASVVFQELLDNSTVDPVYGSVEDLDQSILLAAQRQAEANFSEYLEQTDFENFLDVVGGAKTIVREQNLLPSGLPHASVFFGPRYAALPPALQHHISFALGGSVISTGSNNVSFPWAAINNRKTTLSFRPASSDDIQTLEALVPEGGFSEPGSIPSQIPAYLINVVPELKVGGAVVLSGAPIALGQEVNYSFRVSDPSHGVREYPNRAVAGSYLAIGLIGGSVLVDGSEGLAERIRNTSAVVLGDYGLDGSQIGKEELLGDLFHGGLLSYFGQYSVLGNIMAKTRGAHFHLTNSAGTYGYVPNVNYFFGLPHSVSPGGVLMDLDRVAHMTNTDGSGRDAMINMNFHLGALASGLEHSVPEQMFVAGGGSGQGFSAARAIELAMAKGQVIYHLTGSNQALSLPQIAQDRSTVKEIDVALRAGKEVIVHRDPLSLDRWVGVGYVIFDPVSGASAWKIRGSANGGFLAGADISVTIFGMLISYKAMLAHVWGATKIGIALNNTANSLVGINAMIGIADIANNCRGPALRWVVVSYSAINLTFIGAAGLIAVATGPIGGFAAAALLGVATGYLRTSLTESAFCK